MRTLTKETFQIIKLNRKNLLIFEMVYRIVTFSLFAQAMNHGLRFALRMAGYSYLTLGNLGRFLVKPWTVLVLLGLLVLGMAFLLIEAGGLVTAYSSAAYSRRISAMDILLGGIGNLAFLVKRKNIKLAGVIAVEMTLIYSFYIYRILTHVKPLDFMMKEMLMEPWVRILMIVVTVLFLLIAIPTTFAIHGCMIEQKSFGDSMNRSRDLIRNRRGKTVFVLVLNQLLVIGAVVVCYLLCVVFACVLVVLFVDKKLETAFLIEASAKLEWIALFLGSAVSSLVYFACVTVEYYQCSNRISHAPRWNFNYGQGGMISKKSGLAVLGVVAAISCLCLFDTTYNGNDITKAMAVETGITAHRGSSRIAPENTREAVEAAVEELADYAEIDVRESRDGVVVLFHDVTLKRTAGVNKKLSELTYEELETLDVGSWFSKEYAGVRIPTLDQVMEYAKGKIDLNIEIKDQGNASKLPEKVLALINAHEMQDQCVITSTNINYLRSIKKLQPEIRTGYILAAVYGDYFTDEAIDFISIRSSFVTEDVMKRSHEAGKTVHAWTVNQREELERMRVLGVDNVITDNPVLAREVLYREEAAESLLEYLRLLLR